MPRPLGSEPMPPPHQMMILPAAGIQTDLGLLKVPDNVCYLSTKGEKNETSQIYDCFD